MNDTQIIRLLYIEIKVAALPRWIFIKITFKGDQKRRKKNSREQKHARKNVEIKIFCHKSRGRRRRSPLAACGRGGWMMMEIFPRRIGILHFAAFLPRALSLPSSEFGAQTARPSCMPQIHKDMIKKNASHRLPRPSQPR